MLLEERRTMKYPRPQEALLTGADAAAQHEIQELRRQLEEKDRKIQVLKVKNRMLLDQIVAAK
jgi:hypothetical protein